MQVMCLSLNQAHNQGIEPSDWPGLGHVITPEAVQKDGGEGCPKPMTWTAGGRGGSPQEKEMLLLERQKAENPLHQFSAIFTLGQGTKGRD